MQGTYQLTFIKSLKSVIFIYTEFLSTFLILCISEKVFLHCQAGTVAACHTLQFHCLACVKPRGL